jgi:putative flippase GtrA
MSATASFVSGAFASVKQRGPKYMAVSVVNVAIGQGLLLFFNLGLHWYEPLANAVSVCISAIPAYYLSRRWVWGRSGKSHFKTEVLPFWIFIAIGLVFSTAMVALATHLAPSSAHPTIVQKFLPNLVNAASFFVLWVLRFFLFDKLFTTNPELAEELMGHDFAEAYEGPEAVAAAEAAAEQHRREQAASNEPPASD